MKNQYSKKQITDYATRLSKLELLIFDVISETEEFLKSRYRKTSSMKQKMSQYC